MVMIWKRTDVSVRCMCGDTSTASTALWRRPVLPVVPYRNETRHDVATHTRQFQYFRASVDRQGKLKMQLGSNLALRLARLDTQQTSGNIKSWHRGVCCSDHWICYDRPGLSNSCHHPCAVPFSQSSRSQRPDYYTTLSFSLYGGNHC
jgi:hypothetical protein